MAVFKPTDQQVSGSTPDGCTTLSQQPKGFIKVFRSSSESRKQLVYDFVYDDFKGDTRSSA